MAKLPESNDNKCSSKENNVGLTHELGDIEVTYAKEEQVDRATWGGKVEFMMTCIGFAVGLGNVWRFPYLCYRNGGGAFLIPYCLMIGIIGLPLFFLEFAFGQFASLGPIQIWSISPLFKGIGYTMVFISWILSIYYNVIVARCLFFFGASFRSELPWANCNNTWNNATTCRESNPVLNETMALAAGALSNVTTNQVKIMTPAEEYYTNYVLESSGNINDFGLPVWKMVLSLLACWTLVLIALIKGIQSLGKISYFTALFPYIVLISLFVRSCMLEGAADGILYYIRPDFSRLKDYQVWTDAATQIFFSLSVCNGGLITVSSFNKFKNNFYYDSVIIVIINCATSVFAGLVVFANLGHMAHLKNVHISSVAKEGSGLVFVVYPEALMQMPGSIFWSIIFFLMMLTLGMGSQLSITECVLSGLQDLLIHRKILRTNMSCKIFRVIMCYLNFLLGIPMLCRGGNELLDLVDTVLSSYPLLFVALFELIVVSYIYGINQFKKDVALMIDSKPNWYWRANWLVISPSIVLILLIMTFLPKSEEDFMSKLPPGWQAFGHILGGSIVSIIPIFFLYRYCMDGGFIVLRELSKPKYKWGPANKDDREQFHNMIRSNESMRQQAKIGGVDSRSLLQLVGPAGVGSAYNIHSSIISRNDGLVALTGLDDMSGSGFYQSKLSIADKMAEQYTKSLVKTNPELAAMLLNPNSTAAEAEAMAMALNSANPSSGNLHQSNANNAMATVSELDDFDTTGKARPTFQVGLDPVKSEPESSASQSPGSKPADSK